ncbi:MAG: hypothetical protein GF334_04890 [Candidatus Altiarchaeales archaeon]|nr:hypothetical protein [Candidatus Altiarchaeales archaeon]
MFKKAVVLLLPFLLTGLFCTSPGSSSEEEINWELIGRTQLEIEARFGEPSATGECRLEPEGYEQESVTGHGLIWYSEDYNDEGKLRLQYQLSACLLDGYVVATTESWYKILNKETQSGTVQKVDQNLVKEILGIKNPSEEKLEEGEFSI